MSQDQSQCQELIYDLTQLKSKDHDKVNQLVLLYRKKISHLETDVSHLQSVLQCYKDLVLKITTTLSIPFQAAAPSVSGKDLSNLQLQLSNICKQLAALKQSKIQEVPIMVEKFIEVEKTVDIVKEVEVERIVQVPIEKQVIVEVEIEKIIEVQRPIYIERLIEVEVQRIVPVQQVIEKQVPFYITRQIEVECPYCAKR